MNKQNHSYRKKDKEQALWNFKTAQLVKCLLCKMEDLSSSPTAYGKRLCAIVCTCNSCIGKMETGRSLVPDDQLA